VSPEELARLERLERLVWRLVRSELEGKQPFEMDKKKIDELRALDLQAKGRG